MNFSRRKTITLYLLLFTSLFAGAQTCPVIPLPNAFTKSEGTFILSNTTSIKSTSEQCKFLVDYFIQRTYSIKKIKINAAKHNSTSIEIKLIPAKNTANEEAYSLIINQKTVTLTSSSLHGLFNGVNSLLQIILRANVAGDNKLQLACWNIQDAPAQEWRGFMLDESRHFFGKKIVEQLLDEMAFYKLNYFHWHLTDEPAWRIEIKKYPNLTAIGSAGDYEHRNGAKQFYTQEEIREIVAYAAKRFITIIPEIDMPGHATAANRAYPQYSGGGTVQHPEFTFNPGLDSTYSYLTNILKEVAALFPSKIIHIGGDEVSFGNEKWASDVHIKELMQREHLTALTDVEHYFIKRMADSIIKMGCTAAGWDEVATSGLSSKNTLIFWWRHDHPEQLKYALDKGFRVVECPRLPFYFDFVQRPQDKQGRRWGKSFNTIKNIYNFNSDSISASKNIKGYQAALWTEQVRSVDRLYYMIFPRIVAVAEAAWTKNANKNFYDFNNRIDALFPYWHARNISFCNYKDDAQKEIIDKIVPVKYLDNKAK
ncbi:MAG: beta-N-acetylhexosaminidase [Arachidicoccus sp.]|nr:beta-N-acetylhexosaminidase [Arachidicoccus sp.]